MNGVRNGVLIAVILALAACGGSPTRSSSPDRPAATGSESGSGLKHATVTIKGDPPTLSAGVDQAGSGGTDGLSELEPFVHVGLSAVNGDGHLVPRLAQAVPTIENGNWVVYPDGRMQTTWKLAPNARWQDGAPLTTDDFLFTAMVAQDRTVPLYRESAYEAIDQISAADASTLVITWTRPFIVADSLFTPTGLTRVLPMPKHLLEKAYEEERATFTQHTYWNVDFVGAGPYKVKEWVLGSHLVLAANDYYVLGRPKIDEVEARFILDPSTIVANVLAGSVDVTMGRGVSLEQAIQARDQWGGKGRIEASLLGWTALFPQFLNPTPAQVGDLTFRRAMLHALDRQELSDSLQGGFSPVAYTLYSPNDPEYPGIESSIVKYEYDATRAVALLDSMGLSKGPDGFYRDAGAQRITLEVRTTRDDLRERVIHPIGDYWQRIGIGMEPVIIATQAANDRSYRATFPAFELTRQPPELERYRSTGIPTSENGFRGNNRVRYANPEMDGLLDRYFTTIPRRERTEALGQLVHFMTDQLLTLGIFYTVEPSLINGRVQNVTARKVEDGRISWNANEWDVR